VISRTGRWKRWMVLGGVLLTAGLALMSTVVRDTPFGFLAAALFLIGLGVGMCMQNLVLAVQNSIAVTDMGAASALVAFFRTMGGTVGVSALGALLSSRVTTLMSDGVERLGLPADAVERAGGGGGTVPDVSHLPEPFRTLVEQAYGQAVGTLFLAVVPVAVVAVVAILAIREVPLGTRSGLELRRETEEAVAAPVAATLGVRGVASSDSGVGDLGNRLLRPTGRGPGERTAGGDL